MKVPDLAFENEFEENFTSVLNASAPDLVIRPSLHSAAISCLVFDKDGSPKWASPTFHEWLDAKNIDNDICDLVRKTNKERVVLSKDVSGKPILLTYAPIALATDWPALQPYFSGNPKADHSIVVAALTLAHLSDDLTQAAKALGMDNLEARLAAGLVTHGSIRQAAVHANVTYNTARTAIAKAMKKTNVSRQTSLAKKLTEVSTSTNIPREAAARVLVDLFNFPPRDAELTLLLCEGYTRDESAKIVGISKSIAKDRFSGIFRELDISSATELPRLVMEVFATAMLIKPNAVTTDWVERSHNPLKLFQRDDGSLVATNDYGPKDGKPVLIMHSSMSTRHPYRKVIAALQNKGYRPFTIDRPGFGLTDNCEEAADPFATGVEDVALICQNLGITKIHVITRGGVFSALALARAYPSLIQGGVLISPDLLFHHSTLRHGIVGLVRSSYKNQPDRIESIARWIGAQMSPERANQMLYMALKKSPNDLEAFNDLENLKDHQKSVMVFANGNIAGYVREQRAYVMLEDVVGLENGSNWAIMVGESDAINKIEEMEVFWCSKLPGAKVQRVKNANRFIELSHTNNLIEVLANL